MNEVLNRPDELHFQQQAELATYDVVAGAERILAQEQAQAAQQEAQQPQLTISPEMFNLLVMTVGNTKLFNQISKAATEAAAVETATSGMSFDAQRHFELHNSDDEDK